MWSGGSREPVGPRETGDNAARRVFTPFQDSSLLMEIKVNFLDKLRLEARFDDFTVITDQPIRYKGDGSAPGPPEFDSYARKCLFLRERTFKNATTTAPTAPAPLVFLSLRHEAPRSAPC